jgi:two-component system response regulator (stage 0 sporulation protein A)
LLRVLIVDNNVELCQQLEEFFSQSPDIEPCGVAHDGEAALELIQELSPDVVLLDLTMPKLDGIGVMERIHTLDLEKYPVVIVLTAFARDEMVERMTELGAKYFIVKPINLNILVERIRQFGAATTAAPPQDASVTSRRSSENGSLPGGSLRRAEAMLMDLLHQIGLPSHFKGHVYLKEAVLMVMENPTLLGGLTKQVYPVIAERHHSTPSGVESAIRNALVTTWHRGNREFLITLLGSHLNGETPMPTNSVLIAKLADRLRVAR